MITTIITMAVFAACYVGEKYLNTGDWVYILILYPFYRWWNLVKQKKEF